VQIRGWTMAAASDRGAGAGRAGAAAPRDVPDAVERQLPHRDGFVTFGGTHGDVSTEGLAGPPSRWSSIGPGLPSFSDGVWAQVRARTFLLVPVQILVSSRHTKRPSTVLDRSRDHPTLLFSSGLQAATSKSPPPAAAAGLHPSVPRC